jgi:hypothetical protein
LPKEKSAQPAARDETIGFSFGDRHETIATSRPNLPFDRQPNVDLRVVPVSRTGFQSLKFQSLNSSKNSANADDRLNSGELGYIVDSGD